MGVLLTGQAQLLHEPHHVGLLPVLGDFAVGPPLDNHAVQGHLLPGGGNASEVPAIGCLRGPAGRDKVAFADDLVWRHGPTGERREHRGHHTLAAFGGRWHAGRHMVRYGVGCDEIVRLRYVLRSDDLFKELPHQGVVVFRLRLLLGIAAHLATLAKRIQGSRAAFQVCSPARSRGDGQVRGFSMRRPWYPLSVWGCVVSTGDLPGRIAGRVRRPLANQVAKK
jgi:hypothetical protein